MIYYLIPARAGSKGFPGKNGLLFKHTADSLTGLNRSSVIVSTDHPDIKEMAIERGFIVLHRRDDLASDTASIKSVVLDAIDTLEIKPDDIIIMLYLTYPGRSQYAIDEALFLFEKNKCDSLLCAYPVIDHPYMIIYPEGKPVYNAPFRGTSFIKNDKYRRQDYPPVMVRSHFISIMRAGKVKKLGDNLYNKNTYYRLISKPIDIDTPEDYDRFIHSIG